MGIELLRVDERLIHGQVTVGWGSRLRASSYLVVDDHLATSAWERELMEMGAPEYAAVEFASVETAREHLAEWLASHEPAILLTRDLDHMVRLARGGGLRGVEVNLGGIHDAPDRREVLPYLFLTSTDRDRIRELEAEGALVSARDLPSSPKRSADELLG